MNSSFDAPDISEKAFTQSPSFNEKSDSQSLTHSYPGVSGCKILGGSELLSEKLIKFNLLKNERDFCKKKQRSQKELERFLQFNLTSCDSSFSNIRSSPNYEKTEFFNSLSPLVKEDSRATRTPSKTTSSFSHLERQALELEIGLDDIKETISQNKRGTLQSEIHQTLQFVEISHGENLTIDELVSIDPNEAKSGSLSQNQSSVAKRMRLKQKFISSVIQGHYFELMAMTPHFSKAFLDETEENGYTLFLLFVRTARKDRDYLYLLKSFLELQPALRNEGVSAFHDAITNKDLQSLTILFDHSLQIKEVQVREERSRLKEILSRLPDFYLEMKWDFDSFLIPFVSRLAPSDTFRIWKVGQSVRLDFNLIGFRGIKAKKRETSLIFNIDEFPDKETMNEFHENQDLSSCLWTLSHRHKYYTNPLQRPDNQEREAILEDLRSSIQLETKLDLDNIAVKKSRNWKGNPVTASINGWKSSKFDVRVSFKVALEKKKFKEIEASKLLEDLKLLGKEKTKTLSRREVDLVNGTNKFTDFLVKNPEPSHISLNFRSKGLNTEGSFKGKAAKSSNPEVRETAQKAETKERKNKKVQLNMWLTQEFPLKVSDVSPLISFLANGNQMLQAMGQFIQKENLQEVFKEWGFPARIQVPMNKLVRGNVVFGNFRFLKSGDRDLANLMSIPSDYLYQNRRLAYKTLERRKKRMILTNLLSL